MNSSAFFRLWPARRIALGMCVIALILGGLGCGDSQSQVAEFLQSGNTYLEQEQYEEAIIEFRSVLQIDPNNVEAHRNLATAYFYTDRPREGYWELSETVRLDPEDIDSRIQYTALTMAGRRFDEVLESSDKIIAIEPDNAAAHRFRGQALLALERTGEAEEAMKRAVEIEPDNAAGHLALAALYQQSDQLDKAEGSVRESLEQDPTTLGHTMLAALLNAGDGDDSEIEQNLRSAVDLSLVVDEEGQQGQELVAAYQNLSSFYFDRERSEEAVSVLEEGIQNIQEGKGDLNDVLVRYYRTEGESEKANAVLERATTFDPSDAGPWLSISNVRAQRGDEEGAMEAANKALEADPDSSLARLRKAELLIGRSADAEEENELVAEARLIAEAELAENPSSAQAAFVVGKLELADGNVEKATEHIRNAVELQPNWAQAHFVLGSVLLMTDEPKRARASLARSVELKPDFYEARRVLIQLHAQLGEHEYAIENGRRYLSVRKKDYPTVILVAQSMVRLGMVEQARELLEGIPPENRAVEAHYALGRLAMVEGNAEAATAAFNRADKASPNDPRVLSSLLMVDAADGDVSDSAKRVATALEASPDSAALWRVKGLVNLRQREVKQAEEAFLKSVELDPNAVDNYAQLARIYAASGRLDRAIEQYESAAKAQPTNGTIRHFLGVLYEMTNKPELAQQNYENALELNSDLAETKNNLAYMIAGQEEGDLDRALRLAQEAKAAMPDSPSAADTLGWVLYKRGVSSAAIGYLTEAVSIMPANDPNMGEIRMHLSLAYEGAGDREKAIETLEAAIVDLDELKSSGKISQDPAWAGGFRDRIATLKAAG